MRIKEPMLGDWRQVHYDNGNQVVAFNGSGTVSEQHVEGRNSWRDKRHSTASYSDHVNPTSTFGNQRNTKFCPYQKNTSLFYVNHTASIESEERNQNLSYEKKSDYPVLPNSDNCNIISYVDNHSVSGVNDQTAYCGDESNTRYTNSNSDDVTKDHTNRINDTRASTFAREDFDNTSFAIIIPEYNDTGDFESIDYQSTQNYYPIGLTQDFYTTKVNCEKSAVSETALNGNRVINGNVYNQQYRNHNNELNDFQTSDFDRSPSNTSLFDSLTLEGQQFPVCTELSPVDSLRKHGDPQHIYSSVESTPLGDEDRAFEPSDTDEHSDYDRSRHPLPHGIVNPNYPGFQHFAHALQDYSTNLDNLYSYETDEDGDADIHLDKNYDIRNITKDRHESVGDCNGNSQDDNNKETKLPVNSDRSDAVEHESNVPYDTTNILTDVKLNNLQNSRRDSNVKVVQIPDLLKDTRETNNCVNDNEKNVGCNLFTVTSASTLDIIGDFGKEIEHEIGLIVNRNLTFQEDLDALQRDINEAIKKPIEETINNISEVVSKVIEKLVIEQDGGENMEWLAPFKNKESDLAGPMARSVEENDAVVEKIDQPSRDKHLGEQSQSETSAFTNNNISKVDRESCRPSFLYLGNGYRKKTKNTFLSEVKHDEVIETNNKADFILKSEHLTEGKANDLSLNLNMEVDEPNVEILMTDETPIRSSLLHENMPKTLCKEALFDNATEKEEDTTVPKKQESTYPMNSGVKRREWSFASGNSVGGDGGSGRGSAGGVDEGKGARSREVRVRAGAGARASSYNRRSVPQISRKHKRSSGGFDVYNIESAMPDIDLEAIENHLRAAKEEERLRRNDREEIRRRLAMGTELDELRSLPHTGHDRPARKPSLQSRLQNGMNLQICFMNETASDNESPNSDSESNSGQHSTKPFSAAAYSLNNHPYQTKPLSVSTKHIEAPNLKVGGRVRPSSLALRSPAAASRSSAQSQSLGCIALTEADFFARQARLQTEARMALAQAKEIARMQMEKERRERATSPVTEMVRRGLSKANVSVGKQRRRVSRHMLTDMNIAQLQVIVNELHSQIECLNEGLVTLLMTRDELHMGQDSMLVDIEDLTRFLGAKEQTVGVVPPLSSPFCPTPLRANTTPQRSLLSAPAALLKPRLHRIAALVKKCPHTPNDQN